MVRQLKLPDFSLYGVGLVFVLAVGWLLPNHYPPWSTFHTTAWVGAALLLIGVRTLLNVPGGFSFSLAGLLLLACALIPWAQHALGMLPLVSSATVPSLGLLGLGLAFAVGRHWQRAQPGEPAATVLGAAAIAAVASTAMALYQWFGWAEAPDLTEIWVLSFNLEGRPYANLGQTNQLASLLLWGLLGVALAWRKGLFGGVGACFLAGFILLGVALTESRTALLTLTLFATVLRVWRPAWMAPGFRHAAQGLYAFYLFGFFALPVLGGWLELGRALSLFERSGGEIRTLLWRASLEASLVRPWTGFGWDQVNKGLFEVIPSFPGLIDTYFQQSHNLFIDLVLWVGWPVGVLINLGCLYLLWQACRSATGFEPLLTVAALWVMAIHAMLELPLHYGYFLWPFGVLLGASASGWSATVLTLPRRWVLGLLVALGVVHGVVIRDYMEVESAFTELRFEVYRIGTGHRQTLPQTVLLTEWPQVINAMKSTPYKGMTDAQIKHWEDLLVYNTSPLGFRKLIGALTLNGRRDEAQVWAQRSCWVINAKSCLSFATEWDQQAHEQGLAPESLGSGTSPQGGGGADARR